MADPEATLAEARRVARPLGDWLEAVFVRPLSFAGEHAIMHSSHNHVHLWLMEALADDHPAIDLAFRARVVEAIFARWAARARGDRAASRAGFRLYVYEDLAPTVSIVGETPAGCPYGGRLTFVATPAEVLAPYAKRRWRDHFAPGGPLIGPEEVLAAVAAHAGSIGPRPANALGVPVGRLRRLVEVFELADAVNALRKRHRRVPARFEPHPVPAFRIHERRVPPTN